MFAYNVHFQLHNHNLFEKLLETKFHNTKECPAGLSPIIILLYSPSGPSFDVALWPQPGVDWGAPPPPPRPPNHCEKPCGWVKNPTQQPKIYSFPPQKWQFSCNHSIQALFIAAVIPVIWFLITLAFMYTHVSFSMTKHWMVKIPSIKICILSHLLMLFDKPCFYKCLLLPFSQSLFYFKFYKVSPDPSPVVQF